MNVIKSSFLFYYLLLTFFFFFKSLYFENEYQSFTTDKHLEHIPISFMLYNTTIINTESVCISKTRHI